MSEADYACKLDELDRLLNDPSAPLDAARVWSLLSEIARHTAEPAKDSIRFQSAANVGEETVHPGDRLV